MSPTPSPPHPPPPHPHTLPTAFAVAVTAALVLGLPPRALGALNVPLVAAAPARGNAVDARGADTSELVSACEDGALPDGDACVRLPHDDEGAPDSEVLANAHRERSGRWATYEQIPRRPERAASYDAYRYPTPPGVPGGKSVISGYDLDRPDESQRRGVMLRAIGHGGLDLPQAKGTPVKLVALEHQRGDADVIYVGPLFGTTVVTRHSLLEGGQVRDYLVLFGHLDAAAPGVVPGTHLADDALVGFVGDTGSPELVHLHLEARRVRDGVDVTKVGVGRLLASDVSIVCDPRNVLPLK